MTPERLADLREAHQRGMALSARRALADELFAEIDRLAGELQATRNNRLISAIFGHHAGAPRPFALHRREDETGVSGTGVVAVGVEFPDGMVVLRWTSAFPTSVVFHDRGIESVEAVHGHGGKTQIVWLSDELEPLAAMEQDRDRLSNELQQAHQLLDQYAPVAVPILADIKARKERAVRMAAHTHYCWTCSDGTVPGDGCHNCRNTGMDQTPCVGCPGPQPADSTTPPSGSATPSR